MWLIQSVRRNELPGLNPVLSGTSPIPALPGKSWLDHIGTCLSSSIHPSIQPAPFSLIRVWSVTSTPPTFSYFHQHLVWNDKIVPVQFAAFLNLTRAVANYPFIVGSTHAMCWPGRDHFLWITLSYNTQLFLAWLQLKPVICGINGAPEMVELRPSLITNIAFISWTLYSHIRTHQPCSKVCVGQVQWLETADLPPSCKTTTLSWIAQSLLLNYTAHLWKSEVFILPNVLQVVSSWNYIWVKC